MLQWASPFLYEQLCSLMAFQQCFNCFFYLFPGSFDTISKEYLTDDMVLVQQEETRSCSSGLVIFQDFFGSV